MKKQAFFGFAGNPNALGFGRGKWFSDEYSNFIKGTAKTHHNDRYIALLSKIENAIFISNDKKAYKDTCRYNVKTLFFDIQWSQEDFKNALLKKSDNRCKMRDI